jgi:protein-disulfide isomerase
MRFAPALFALALAAACPADTLTLRNGEVVTGVYQGGTARTVKMEIGDTIKTFNVTDISKLEFTPGTTAPTATRQPAVEGIADSPVRVVIYEDLQCPDCAAFRRMMDEKILPQYGAKVAFVHRDFPLAKHAWARQAAIAARFFAEKKPEAALEYRRYTLAGIPVTDTNTFSVRLASFAQAHGVDQAAAIAALNDARYAQLVEKDYQEGVARGVVHTPTVFVNGKAYVETFTFEEFSKGLDEALAQAR